MQKRGRRYYWERIFFIWHRYWFYDDDGEGCCEKNICSSPSRHCHRSKFFKGNLFRVHWFGFRYERFVLRSSSVLEEVFENPPLAFELFISYFIFFEFSSIWSQSIWLWIYGVILTLFWKKIFLLLGNLIILIYSSIRMLEKRQFSSFLIK